MIWVDVSSCIVLITGIVELMNVFGQSCVRCKVKRLCA
jgi:hypothetical protein